MRGRGHHTTFGSHLEAGLDRDPDRIRGRGDAKLLEQQRRCIFTVFSLIFISQAICLLSSPRDISPSTWRRRREAT